MLLHRGTMQCNLTDQRVGTLQRSSNVRNCWQPARSRHIEGTVTDISSLCTLLLERLDEALWQPHGPLRSRWMITHAFDKERKNTAKDKDVPVCCQVSGTSDMHTLLCSA